MKKSRRTSEDLMHGEEKVAIWRHAVYFEKVSTRRNFGTRKLPGYLSAPSVDPSGA